ncbi:unnamed protein product [Penicillium nalgiovense]|uniref:SUN domain-containing protein n=2 Tax=Penicillium nalgiovense TaxID=60175 RepID=A0A9W4I2A4_PENNA|nr:unnamed protein product [Penicillium nalgiovense]CAG8005096.1 unnamed protein product [Penicillium nalgiovense]CAG8006348.1 unnamed protein product [Penicillium nalgiovense]CAG8018638.1 unnamed protein product [Penicillium nalgiovense]CAG8060751.1 unnamed protein product [Penicillium nalgiovense]
MDKDYTWDLTELTHDDQQFRTTATMKFQNTVAALATAGLATAHGHGHAHAHKRATETETVSVPGPVVYDFVVLDPSKPGAPEPISIEKACEGLANNEFEWLNSAVASACPSSSSSTATPTSTSTAAPTTTATVAPAILQETSAVITPASSTSTVEPTSSSTSSSTTAAASTSSSSSSSSSGATGLTADFPDGEIDCGDFPSDYGAVALDYLGLDGWSGIQYVTILDNLVSDIVTAVTGDKCHSGAMCSYACPPGYQKSQWPTTQGSTGQSVGGLECKIDNKLYLTNEDHQKLCIPGVGGVHVKNEMSESVAVCRTDYPGTESETIPLNASPGAVQDLTCPSGEEYFKWKGKKTSAQYYVNPKGVSTEKGCQWGDGSEPIGNYAPLNLGVGETDAGKFLSIFPNAPTTYEKLDFNVRIEGDNLSGECRYEGGKFYDSKGLISGNSGCTVGVTSGAAYFVFYSN